MGPNALLNRIVALKAIDGKALIFQVCQLQKAFNDIFHIKNHDKSRESLHNSFHFDEIF